MSVCVQNGQGEDDSAPEEMGASVRDLYKQKPASKVVRVLTVLAYLLSVSLAAILLSVYYVCVWKSPELPLMNNTQHEQFSALIQPDTQIHNSTFHNFTGRSGSTVIPATQPALDNDTYGDGEVDSTSPNVADLAPNVTSVPTTTIQSHTATAVNTTDSIT